MSAIRSWPSCARTYRPGSSTLSSRPSWRRSWRPNTLGNNCADEVGERNDWVELYNTGDVAVDLAGYSLTDDTASPRKSVIPEGVTIEARSALLFWADATPDQGKTQLSSKLKAKTEEVVLYDAETRQVDLYRWAEGYSDISFARVPDGTGEWVRCAQPTCGAENSSACGS